jgi:hypothetical protein
MNSTDGQVFFLGVIKTFGPMNEFLRAREFVQETTREFYRYFGRTEFY